MYHNQGRNVNMNEITVYLTWDEPMADMAMDLLNGMGIHARIVAEMTRSIYPFTMDGLGELQIVVPEEESNRAIELLNVRFSEEGIVEDFSEDEFSRDDYGESGEEKENE